MTVRTLARFVLRDRPRSENSHRVHLHPVSEFDNQLRLTHRFIALHHRVN